MKDRRIQLIYEIQEKSKELAKLMEELKVLNAGISRACRKTRKTAGGFKWEFVNP